MQVCFTEYLPVTNIGYGVWTDILGVDLKVGEHVTEKFSSGGSEASAQVISKYNNFFVLGFSRKFWTGDSPMNSVLLC